jgi:hypothetical protein
MSFPLKNHGWTRIDTDLNHPCSSVFIRGLFSNFEILDIIFDSFLNRFKTAILVVFSFVLIQNYQETFVFRAFHEIPQTKRQIITDILI